MKFINYLKTISGVEIHPLISLLLFFVFFTLVTVWAIKANKEQIKHLEQLPLDNSKK